MRKQAGKARDRHDGRFELVRKIVDEVTAKQLGVLQLLRHRIKAIGNLAEGGIRRNRSAEPQPRVKIPRRKAVELIDQLVDRLERQSAAKKGHKSPDDQARQRHKQQHRLQIQISFHVHKHAKLRESINAKCRKADGQREDHKNEDRKNDRQRRARGTLTIFYPRASFYHPFIFPHPFFTALYPSPRTASIWNSSQPSKRRRKRAICTVTVSHPVSLSAPQISSMSWIRVKILPG